MSKTLHEYSDHGPYMEAVRAALTARDVPVTEVSVVPRLLGSCREAVIDFEADPTIIRQDRKTEFFEGTQVLPDPDAVTAWMVIVLTHPDAETVRDIAWFRQSGVYDPEFEARLASYVPAG